MTMNTQVRKLAKAKRRNDRKDKQQLRRATVKALPKMLGLDEHSFWLAHGANFLASSHDEAIWTPVFPDIYEVVGLPPEVDKLQKVIHTRFFDTDKGAWKPEGVLVASWLAQDQTTTAVVKERAIALAGQSGALDPRNPKVWALFDHLGKTAFKPATAKSSVSQ